MFNMQVSQFPHSNNFDDVAWFIFSNFDLLYICYFYFKCGVNFLLVLCVCV